MGDFDLGCTAIINCGGGDVLTVDWLRSWFPVRYFRENARACYYFKSMTDFIQDKNSYITGFKSKSKHYPVNAKSCKDPPTYLKLPSKVFCASFEGKSRLSVEGVHLSPSTLYTTLVVSFKCSNSEVSSLGENIVTDCNRALTVQGGDIRIFGSSSSPISIIPSKKLDEWNTVYIQWGTDADRSGHVYVNGKHEQEFTSNVGRPHLNELHIGGLSDDIPGFWSGFLSNLEVYSTESPLSGEIRTLIMEDHQNSIG